MDKILHHFIKISKRVGVIFRPKIGLNFKSNLGERFGPKPSGNFSYDKERSKINISKYVFINEYQQKYNFSSIPFFSIGAKYLP